ncbi:MAG: transposase [Promethearchaeota archaeon]|nr:MAG: transposase [Candidatus Lokiarchaeota archaeon]
MEYSKYLNDWQLLMQFFPEDWEEMAYKLGAISRSRKIKSPADLMRVLLIHLTDNCSLKETVVRAKYGNIIDISSVALMKRLNKSSEWFRWMSNRLLFRRGIIIDSPNKYSKFNIKSVDASIISEPGSTGTDWRLHYSFELFNLKCDQFFLTRQNVGESFTNFKVCKNDLFIGDRAYGRANGMNYIQSKRAFFISRYMNRAYTLYDSKGNKFKLLDKIKKLNIGEVLEIPSQIRTKSIDSLKIRIIVMKKSKEKAEEAVKKAIKEQKRKQRNINPETIKYHEYIILITNLNGEVTTDDILELYRLRWQVEIAFKHLKSIFGLGHLPKEGIESARAWLHGKLFVALLTQAIVDEGLLFSPWGYPFEAKTAT